MRRVAAVAATAACALGIVGCSTEVAGNAQPATVHAGDMGAMLEALLLDDRDIASIVEAPIQTVDPYSVLLVPSRRQYSDEKCAQAFSTASATAYGATSISEIRGRQLLDSDDHDGQNIVFTRAVDQAVIGFSSDEAARAFIARSQRVWAACAGTTVETLDDGTDSRLWRIGESTVTGGVLSTTAHLASGWAVQHALAAQGNIVIDVCVTMYDVGDQATNIVGQIAERFSQ